MLRPSIVGAGLDPDALPAQLGADTAAAMYGSGAAGPRRWQDIWSAGHSVSGVQEIDSVAALVERTRREYEAARAASASLQP